jgi:cytochrome c peroxidase
MAVLLPAACGAPGASTRGPDGNGSARDSGAVHADSGAVSADAGEVLPWSPGTFPEVLSPPDNPSTDAKIALGRTLFYDPVVSVDHQTACGTCHSEFWGMTDGLPVSIGNGAGLLAGPGRHGPNTTRRNAPTLWNVAFRESLFWDGHAATLEDQVHFPFDAAGELGRAVPDVVLTLRGIPTYATLFATAFPDDPAPVTGANLSRAIAAFERTMISRGGLYDAYVEGDPGAMSDAMLRGMRLFAKEGCVDCHRPPLFSSERFADRNVPPIPGVEDAGRYEVTHDEADRNHFAVPTLRNLHDSAPFFHTGAVATVNEAVRHEVAESVSRSGAPALDDGEIDDLTTFLLKGLFDSKNSPSRPHEVPSGLPLPIDGFAIRR